MRPAKSRTRSEQLPPGSPSGEPASASAAVTLPPLDAEPAKAIVAGLQEVGAELTAYAEHTLGQAMRLARSLIDAGSLGDVIALQQKFAQQNFETFLTRSTRVSEIGLRTSAILLGSAPDPKGEAA